MPCAFSFRFAVSFSHVEATPHAAFHARAPPPSLFIAHDAAAASFRKPLSSHISRARFLRAPPPLFSAFDFDEREASAGIAARICAAPARPSLGSSSFTSAQPSRRCARDTSFRRGSAAARAFSSSCSRRLRSGHAQQADGFLLIAAAAGIRACRIGGAGRRDG